MDLSNTGRITGLFHFNVNPPSLEKCWNIYSKICIRDIEILLSGLLGFYII